MQEYLSLKLVHIQSPSISELSLSASTSWWVQQQLLLLVNYDSLHLPVSPGFRSVVCLWTQFLDSSKMVIGFQFIQHFVIVVLVRISMFPSSLHFGPENDIGVNHKMKWSLGSLSGQILHVLNFSLLLEY